MSEWKDSPEFKKNRAETERLSLVDFLEIVVRTDYKCRIHYAKIVEKRNCEGVEARLEILEGHIKKLKEAQGE